MTKQLTLISSSGRPRAWRLDERTRAIGRKGVAEARTALQAGRRPQAPGPPRDAPPGVRQRSAA